jgi:glycosyltransferase involved in cell wall biosynthesis
MEHTEPKKIAVLGLSYPFRGGISHYSTLLVRELRKKYEVKFFTLKRQYPDLLFPGKTQYDYSKEKLIEENDSIIDSINPATWIKTAFLLKKENVDLVIIQWWNPFFGLSFGTIANIISLISKSDICFLCHNIVAHEDTIFDKMFSRYAFFNAKYFIVHSEEDKKNLLNIKSKVIVKKNFHPTYSVFSDFIIYEKIQARRKLNIAQNKNVVLFFGLVRPYKGLKYLVYAMLEVIKHKECMLLIVGEFYESKDEYRSLIKRFGLDNYITVVDKYVSNEDVPLYFCSADVVVLPYIAATQSGIIQIAFGLNKPVITTNVGGLPEVVEDGKTGFVVEAKSPEQLSEAIIKYYQGNYESKFREEIKKRSNVFSWDAELESIEFFLAQKCE